MKKLILSLPILFSFLSANAQITKEATIDIAIDYYTIVNTYGGLNFNGPVEKFINRETISTTQKKFTIYNLDYSVYKVMTLTIPDGMVFASILQFPTTKLFNSDDLIEFIYSYRDNTNNTIYYKLINENNEILYDFGSEQPVYAFLSAKEGFKLLTGSSGNSNIYSLGTTLLSGVNQQSFIQADKNPFPNPAKQIINLPYQLEQGMQATMKVFDVNGKQITTKLIDSIFDKILLDVSAYQKGMYVYEVNGKSSKFLVE